MNKKIILAVIVALGLIFGFYRVFLIKENQVFNLFKVARGNVFQLVSETGTVKKGEEIILGFKNSGKIEKIYVEVGQKVSFGETLAEIDTTELNIQLKEAKSALEVAQAQLDKLLAGASKEEIQLAQTKVTNAQIELENAEQNLEDVKLSAKDSLDSAYEDALEVLGDSFLKSYNALKVVDSIVRSYFTDNKQGAISAREKKDEIEIDFFRIKSLLEDARSYPENRELTDTALLKIKESLTEIYDALGQVRDICDEPTYRSVVSLSDKTSLDNQRDYTNTAKTNTIDSSQTVSSIKLTNDADTNRAQAQVFSKKGALFSTKDELNQVTALPRQEDIDLNNAKVNQAGTQISILENQIRQALLKSPAKGQITKVKKRPGEMVYPGSADSVIVLLPDAPFEIRADIYEEDVVKMEIGNPVEISLVAFPGRVFRGRVISIEPAEKIIEGVVYYEVVVNFDQTPESLKPGMTADLLIETAKKENVLFIPEGAIEERDGKTIVQVSKNGVLKEKEIKTGLLGSEGMIEIVFGLEEGEEVLVK